MPTITAMLRGLGYIQHEKFESQRLGHQFVHVLGVIVLLQPTIFADGARCVCCRISTVFMK